MTNGERYKTYEERIDAHFAYCESRVGDCDDDGCDRCAFAWLAMEYKPKPMPCPFCGCDETKIERPNDHYISVKCAKCGIGTGWRISENDAIEVWNRRFEDGNDK